VTVGVHAPGHGVGGKRGFQVLEQKQKRITAPRNVTWTLLCALSFIVLLFCLSFLGYVLRTQRAAGAGDASQPIPVITPVAHAAGEECDCMSSGDLYFAESGTCTVTINGKTGMWDIADVPDADGSGDIERGFWVKVGDFFAVVGDWFAASWPWLTACTACVFVGVLILFLHQKRKGIL